MVPVTIGTSSLDYAGTETHQRKVFYGASRFWEFYSNGSYIVFRSSLDGVSWSATSNVILGVGYGFSLWWDGTFVHYVYAHGSVFYRRGTPNVDGTITWSADEQTAVECVDPERAIVPFLCVDSSGYAVIAYTYAVDRGTGQYYPYVVKSGDNDGTWGATPAGFPYQLNAASASSTWRAMVLPFSVDDKLIAIYAKSGQAITSQTYDGAAWEAEIATALNIEGTYFSAVVTSDDEVHMVFLEDVNYDILYTHSDGSAWEAEETVYLGTSATMAPVLSRIVDSDDLYCFWLGDPTANHVFYKAQIGGTWDVAETDWLTEANIVDNDRISCAYEYATGNGIPVTWVTGPSAYKLRFCRSGNCESFGGSLTPSGGLGRNILVDRVGSIQPYSTVGRKTIVTKTGSMTPTGSISWHWVHSMTGALTSVGALTLKPLIRFTGSLTSSGALGLKVRKVFVGVMTNTGSLGSRILKVLSGSMTPTGNTGIKTKLALDGSMTPTGGMVHKVFITLIGLMTNTGSMAQKPKMHPTGSLTPTGAITKKPKKDLSGSMTNTGSLSGKPRIILGGALSFIGDMAQKPMLALSGALTSSGALTRNFKIQLSGALSFIGVVGRKMRLSLTGSMTNTGNAAVKPKMHLSGSLTSSGALSTIKRFVAHLSGSLTMTGTIGKRAKSFLTLFIHPRTITLKPKDPGDDT